MSLFHRACLRFEIKGQYIPCVLQSAVALYSLLDPLSPALPVSFQRQGHVHKTVEEHVIPHISRRNRARPLVLSRFLISIPLIRYNFLLRRLLVVIAPKPQRQTHPQTLLLQLPILGRLPFNTPSLISRYSVRPVVGRALLSSKLASLLFLYTHSSSRAVISHQQPPSD